MDELEQRVKHVIAEQFCLEGSDGLRPDTKFDEDLGGDSMDTIEMSMALEEEFGFDDPDAQSFEKLKTVGDAIEYVRRMKGAVGK